MRVELGFPLSTNDEGIAGVGMGRLTDILGRANMGANNQFQGLTGVRWHYGWQGRRRETKKGGRQAAFDEGRETRVESETGQRDMTRDTRDKAQLVSSHFLVVGLGHLCRQDVRKRAGCCGY
jgi:hypothetical protein